MGANLIDVEDELLWLVTHLASSRVWIQHPHAGLGKDLSFLINYTINFSTQLSELGVWQPLPITTEISINNLCSSSFWSLTQTNNGSNLLYTFLNMHLGPVIILIGLGSLKMK